MEIQFLRIDGRQAKPQQRFKRTQKPFRIYTHSIFYISLKCNFILCCSSAYFSSILSMRLESSCQIVTFNSIFVPFQMSCFPFLNKLLLILCYYEEALSLSLSLRISYIYTLIFARIIMNEMKN